MKCILHIGTEKTATTLIQNWIYENKNILNSFGVYLSNVIGVPNNIELPTAFTDRVNNQTKVRKLENQRDRDNYHKKVTQALASEVKLVQGKYDTFLISAEHLHSQLTNTSTIQRLYYFLKSIFSSIEIICYFRHQSDLAYSLYSTALKSSCTVSASTFVNRAWPRNYYYNHLSIAHNWTAIFGSKHTHFRAFDQSNFINSDIRDDFIHQIYPDFPTERLSRANYVANQSLTGAQARAFQMINMMVPLFTEGKPGMSSMNKAIKKKVLQNTFFDVGRIPQDKKSEIEKRFEIVNAEFCELYLQSENIFLKYVDHIEPFDSSYRKDDTISDRDIRQIIENYILEYDK